MEKDNQVKMTETPSGIRVMEGSGLCRILDGPAKGIGKGIAINKVQGFYHLSGEHRLPESQVWSRRI